jgi:hypothetical protein
VAALAADSWTLAQAGAVSEELDTQRRLRLCRPAGNGEHVSRHEGQADADLGKRANTVYPSTGRTFLHANLFFLLDNGLARCVRAQYGTRLGQGRFSFVRSGFSDDKDGILEFSWNFMSGPKLGRYCCLASRRRHWGRNCMHSTDAPTHCQARPIEVLARDPKFSVHIARGRVEPCGLQSGALRCCGSAHIRLVQLERGSGPGRAAGQAGPLVGAADTLPPIPLCRRGVPGRKDF